MNEIEQVELVCEETNGLAVELRPGREARQVWYELRRAKQEWMALLTTWRIRRKCGIKEG